MTIDDFAAEIRTRVMSAKKGMDDIWYGAGDGDDGRALDALYTLPELLTRLNVETIDAINAFIAANNKMTAALQQIIREESKANDAKHD